MKNICERLLPNFILKRDSKTSVFPWILWIIQEQLFCRGSANGWFWNTSAVYLFNKVTSLTAWRHLTVLESGSSTGICEFCEVFRKAFGRKLLSNQVSHDVVFYLFADQCGLQPKINFFGGAIRRRSSQASSMLCSYGNQEETSLSNCGHTCSDLGIGSGRKVRNKKVVKVAWIFLLCNVRLQNFHMPEK